MCISELQLRKAQNQLIQYNQKKQWQLKVCGVLLEIEKSIVFLIESSLQIGIVHLVKVPGQHPDTFRILSGQCSTIRKILRQRKISDLKFQLNLSSVIFISVGYYPDNILMAYSKMPNKRRGPNNKGGQKKQGGLKKN